MLRNEEKLSLIADAWLMKQTSQVPFVVEVGKPHQATIDFYENDQNELDWNEKYHHGLVDVIDYNVPNIKPNVGIGIVASAFGCESIPSKDADPWIRPIITESNVDRVYHLQKPVIEDSQIYQRAFARLEYLQSHSNLPLRLLNVPSPLVTASQIWEYTSFIEGTLSHPKEVHHLLELVTDAIIEYVGQQLLRIRNLYTMGHEPFYIPQKVGLRISDDTAAVMSPSTFREFGVPYNARIAKAFKGLVWHSCGDVANVLQSVLETPELHGIDIVLPQNNWQKVREATGDKVAMIARYYYWDHQKEGVDLAEYTKGVLEYFGKRGILILCSADSFPGAISLSKMLQEICVQ
jgi:hypothetical protein